jgi:hypothetical protein
MMFLLFPAKLQAAFQEVFHLQQRLSPQFAGDQFTVGVNRAVRPERAGRDVPVPVRQALPDM